MICFAVIIFMFAGALTVYAVDHGHEQIYNRDFTISYMFTRDNAFFMYYDHGGLFSKAWASTEMSVSQDMTGFVSIEIWGVNSYYRRNESSTYNNGRYKTPSAKINSSNTPAKKTVHFGMRTLNNITDRWTVTIT